MRKFRTRDSVEMMKVEVILIGVVGVLYCTMKKRGGCSVVGLFVTV